MLLYSIGQQDCGSAGLGDAGKKRQLFLVPKSEACNLQVCGLAGCWLERVKNILKLYNASILYRTAGLRVCGSAGLRDAGKKETTFFGPKI